MELHMELERRLAAFKNVEAVVVFQSGFAANAGTVSAILDQRRRRHLGRAESREHHRRLPVEPRGDQGVSAQGRRRRAQDPEGAARRPAQAAHHRRRLLDGRRSRPAAGALRRRRRVRRHHDGGRRACERRVWAPGPRHGRSLRLSRPRRHSGRHAVEGDRRARRVRRRDASDFIEFLYHRARPFLFSTSHPPAVAAACIAALDVLENRAAVDGAALGQHPLLQGRPAALGFNTGRSESPITPVIVGEAPQAMAMSDRLFQRRRVRAGHRVPDRRARAGAAAHDRRQPRTRARICSSRWTCSAKSGRNWG